MSAPQPEPTPLPDRGWTAEKRVLFLDRLACHGNARAAASEVGMSVQTAYRLRRRDALFARGWNAALLLARDTGAQVLAERAIEGTVEEVWYRGELIGTRRRFDTRLLLAHLGRLDRLADEAGAGEDAGRFDQLLACVAGEKPPEELAFGDDPVPPGREEAGELADKAAEAELAREWRRQGMDPAAELDDERHDAMQTERWDRRGQAVLAAMAAWDEWASRAETVVDALIGDDAPLPGLPGNPFAAAPPEAANLSSALCNPRNLAPGGAGPLSPGGAGPGTD